MKIITAALLLCASAAMAPAHAAQLDDANRTFVHRVIVIVSVMSACPGYEYVHDGMTKSGDLLGADSAVINAAIMAYMAMRSGEEYDRSLLIPEVTRQIVADEAQIEAAKKQSRANFCKDFGELSVSLDLLKRTK
jgi:hypothetical protein